MAEVRGINVSSGLGTGEAQVIRTPQTERALWRQLELKKQNQKVEKDKFYENLAKIDTKGIKVQDMPKFDKLRQDVIDKNAAIGNARTSAEKRQYKRELEEAMSRIQLEAVRSRQAAEFDKTLSTEAFKNWDNFDDETRQKIQYNLTLPSDHPEYKMDFLYFTPQAKDVDVLKSFNKISSQALKTLPSQLGGKVGDGLNEIITEQQYDPNIEFNAAKLEFSSDRKLMNLYTKNFNLLSEEDKQKVGSPFELFFGDYQNSKKAPETKKDFRGNGRTVVNINNGLGKDNQGLPGIEGGRVINIKTYNPQGGVSTQTYPSTSIDGFVFKPVSLQIAKSSNIRNTETLEPITDVGLMNINVGDMEVVPTYKKGSKLSSGKDVSGMPIPNDKLENAKKNNAIEYNVVAFFNDQENNSYQGNAKEIVESAQFLSESGKDDKSFILEKYNSLRKKAEEENKKLKGGSTSTATKYSEAEEKGISAFMTKNNISREEAVKALVNAGRLRK